MPSIARSVSIFLAGCLAAVPAARPSDPLSVRVEPAGCEPEPPFAVALSAEASGPRSARIEVGVVPRIPAIGIDVSVVPLEGTRVEAADPPATLAMSAGERFTWSGRIALEPGTPGARVLVRVRMRGAPEGPTGPVETVAALREVVLGAPPDRPPGAVVRVGGEEMVEIPAVPLR